MKRIYNFISGSWDELKNITWPKRPVVIKLTITIIGISLFVAFYLGALDLLFSKLLSLMI